MAKNTAYYQTSTHTDSQPWIRNTLFSIQDWLNPWTGNLGKAGLTAELLEEINMEVGPRRSNPCCSKVNCIKYIPIKIKKMQNKAGGWGLRGKVGNIYSSINKKKNIAIEFFCTIKNYHFILMNNELIIIKNAKQKYFLKATY